MAGKVKFETLLILFIVKIAFKNIKKKGSGGNFFNIGSNSLKQIKTCNAAPIETSSPSTKLASLSWQGRTLILNYHDNRQFSYLI